MQANNTTIPIHALFASDGISPNPESDPREIATAGKASIPDRYRQKKEREFERELPLTACHEAAHVVVAWYLDIEVRSVRVGLTIGSIDSGFDSFGKTDVEWIGAAKQRTWREGHHVFSGRIDGRGSFRQSP
jgi:hypothetical protein